LKGRRREERMALRIIEIKKGELRKKTVEYKWSAHAEKTIARIIREWLDSDLAQSVLLFFKEDTSGELHAYMPIVPLGAQDPPRAQSLAGAKGAAQIIGIEPYPLDGKILAREDIDFIARTMRQENYWNGNEVFRMSDQGNVQTFDTDTPPTWETIKFGRDRIRAVKEAGGRTPTHLVRAVESMQREYDELTGFAQCQLESHAFAIKLEGIFNKGRFVAEDLIRLIENHFDLFKIASPGGDKPFTVHLSAFVPGSSCLVGDYDISPGVDEKTDRVAVKESIAETEKRIASIVRAAPVLGDTSKSPAERVKEFKEATGLSNEDAYAAMHDLSKLRAPHQTIDLYTNHPTTREETQAGIKITGATATQIAETKRVLAALIEPEDTRQLTGKIVELDHYRDDDLKFGIFVEEEARLYTVHYSEKEDKTVREKKGTVTSLVVLRERVNKPWYFKEWK
jgi:hypothetical protein